MNTFDLKGRTALVTGGASGIGFATAQRLLESGARVEIWGRDRAKLDAAAMELARIGSVTVRSVDVSDHAAVRRGAGEALAALGHVDILVNCAGASETVAMMRMSVETWRATMAVNLDSVFYCCNAFAPGMVERGWGRIVNVSSMAGKEGNPLQSAYSSAKAGVIAFTKSVGKELATTGVTVNAIAPTLFDTPLSRATLGEEPELRDAFLKRIPMQRQGRVEEAAALVAWIASEECSFTTGFTFDLSGGRATY